MDRLFTPWRLDYVRQGEHRGDDCVFCACQGGRDEQEYILH
ncbi:HIT family hydrolase, partial [bacterium]|nr:HIT family hydrolase [bacterium]